MFAPKRAQCRLQVVGFRVKFPSKGSSAGLCVVQRDQKRVKRVKIVPPKAQKGQTCSRKSPIESKVFSQVPERVYKGQGWVKRV
jgi:hypothetical protein